MTNVLRKHRVQLTEPLVRHELLAATTGNGCALGFKAAEPLLVGKLLAAGTVQGC